MPSYKCFHPGVKEPNCGPVYCHLGTAGSLKDLRKHFENRCEVQGKAIRLEKAVYCQNEGKSENGCPVAINSHDDSNVYG